MTAHWGDESSFKDFWDGWNYCRNRQRHCSLCQTLNHGNTGIAEWGQTQYDEKSPGLWRVCPQRNLRRKLTAVSHGQNANILERPQDCPLQNLAYHATLLTKLQTATRPGEQPTMYCIRTGNTSPITVNQAISERRLKTSRLPATSGLDNNSMERQVKLPLWMT